MIRVAWLILFGAPLLAADLDDAVRTPRSFNFRAVRMAVEDLSRTFGERYPEGHAYLHRLRELEPARAIEEYLKSLQPEPGPVDDPAAFVRSL